MWIDPELCAKNEWKKYKPKDKGLYDNAYSNVTFILGPARHQFTLGVILLSGKDCK